MSAYDAAVNLADDTTMDDGGQYTCIWMDTHYNWSDPALKNQCGESLNLAVNAVANVLRTFNTGVVVVPEFPAWMFLPLFLFGALFAVAAKRR